MRQKLTIGYQILPKIISSDSELWAQAKRAVSRSDPLSPLDHPGHTIHHINHAGNSLPPPPLFFFSLWPVY